ncbi:ubiquitin-protein ligase (E3) [Marasmius tenuissimus]|uniref:HECT-type E3 ubiquitin transferase n=1 Tax=Marasmius tenuissimus TaxID=585030 RepID=A0ABR2ZQ82_9AGAR
MLPLFTGTDPTSSRRRINLGGASSSSSSAQSTLESAKARRNERLEHRRRVDAASQIQAWWRGLLERRAVRERLSRELDSSGKWDVDSIRRVCFIGSGDVVGRWSRGVVESGKVDVGILNSHPYLLQKLPSTLLSLVSSDINSVYAPSHLTLLTFLVPLLSSDFDITTHISQCIRTSTKDSPCLPQLVTLLFSSPTSTHTKNLIKSILTTPLLPNRLPLPVLTQFSIAIATPLAGLSVDKVRGVAAELSLEDRIHLLSNLLAFVTPRVSKLPKTAVEAYVYLLADLLENVPAEAFDLDARASHIDDSEEEEEEEEIRVRVVETFDVREEKNEEKMPDVDSKTMKRIQSLVSGSTVTALLGATSTKRMQVYRLLLAVFRVWPTKKEGLIDLLFATGGGGGGIVKDLWRGTVRSSGLGREGVDSYDVLVPQQQSRLLGQDSDPWPALLLLCEIYTQVLGTMGDDEFFSPSSSGNPLALDDIRLLSRMVLNIVWVMYTQPPPPTSSTSSFMATRGTLTTLLRALHARDARRAYVPEGHWIKLPSGGGGEAFIEAALVEEEKLLLAEQGDTDVDDDDTMDIDIDYPEFSSSRARRTTRPKPTTTRARKALEQHLAKHQRILQDIPFSIPFDLRVRVFRGFVVLDGVVRRSPHSQGSVRDSLTILSNPSIAAMYTHRGHYSTKKRIDIRRGHVAQDGFDKLHLPTRTLHPHPHEEGWNWKHPLEIGFIDQWGTEEAGIDGGGLFKEFFTELCKETFDPRRGLWATTEKEEEREVYPRPSKTQEEPYALEWYNFMGKVVGKAMYEGILVDVVFARFFLARWLSSSSTSSSLGKEKKGVKSVRMTLLDDLRSLDEEVWRGLVFLKRLPPAEVEPLGLRFCVDVEEFGETTTYDLIPNGSQVAVTRDNRMQYIHLLSHFKLIKQLRLQSTSFFNGISELIQPRWVRMFTPRELSNLISGVGGGDAKVDIGDLRRWTRYGGLYSGFDGHDSQQQQQQQQQREGGFTGRDAQKQAEKTIEWFWTILHTFGEEEKRGLLKFVTSCGRPPLLGFKELNPHFAIRDAGEDQDRLPTASTCVNLLKVGEASEVQVTGDIEGEAVAGD